MSDEEHEETIENLETKEPKKPTATDILDISKTATATPTPTTSFIGKSTAHKIQKPRGVLVRRKIHKRKLRDQMYAKAVRLSTNQLSNLPQYLNTLKNSYKKQEHENAILVKRDRALSKLSQLKMFRDDVHLNQKKPHD